MGYRLWTCGGDLPPLQTHDYDGKQNTRLPETWTDTGQKLRCGERGVLGEAGRVRWDQTLPPCAKWTTFRRLHSRHITCLALLHPFSGLQTMTILVVVGILEVYHPPTPLSPCKPTWHKLPAE